jgi:hypothetical protein
MILVARMEHVHCSVGTALRSARRAAAALPTGPMPTRRCPWTKIRPTWYVAAGTLPRGMHMMRTVTVISPVLERVGDGCFDSACLHVFVLLTRPPPANVWTGQSAGHVPHGRSPTGRSKAAVRSMPLAVLSHIARALAFELGDVSFNHWPVEMTTVSFTCCDLIRT